MMFSTIFLFTEAYASFLGKALVFLGVFVLLVAFVIPRFFPALQYKIETFRNRKKGDDDGASEE